MSEPILVEDLRPDLRNALKERGFALNDTVTAETAVHEWSAWHLGSGDWAETIIDLFQHPKGHGL